jgi:membrane associated rhomboid family serine protease
MRGPDGLSNSRACKVDPLPKPSREKQMEEQDHLLLREWEVPRQAHIVPLGLTAIMTWICYLALPSRFPDAWLLSWTQVNSGHLAALVLYMFAHISWVHLATNCLALIVLGGPLIACLGAPPLSWGRFLYLYLGSGICGGLLFMVIHQDATPVLGASGAIFGVLGALARVHPATQAAVPIGSRRTWLLTKFFLSNHALLIAIVVTLAVLTGQVHSFAWEAHLGGLLFGFVAAPLFLERDSPVHT